MKRRVVGELDTVGIVVAYALVVAGAARLSIAFALILAGILLGLGSALVAIAKAKAEDKNS